MPAWIIAIVTASAQAMPLVVVCLSIHVTLGYLRFPDLSAPGAFLCGAYAFAAAQALTGSSTLALMAAMTMGLFVGGLTAIAHFYGKINSLLAGLLVGALSISLGGRIGFLVSDAGDWVSGTAPSSRTSILMLEAKEVFVRQALERASQMVNEVVFGDTVSLQWAQAAACVVIAVVGAGLVARLSRTQAGVLVRAVGDNRPFADRIGLSVRRLGVAGVAAGGLLAGLAGAIALLNGRVSVGTDFGGSILVEGFLSYFLGLSIATARRRDSAPTTWFGVFTLSFSGAWLLSYVRAVVQVYASRLNFLEDTDYSAIFVLLVVLTVLGTAGRRANGRPDEPLSIY